MVTWIDYPAELRDHLLVSGFRTNQPDRRVVAQPSRGRGLVRRGTPVGGGQPVTGITVVTRPLLYRIKSFWRVDLVEGTLPFRIKDQQLDGATLLDENYAPILDENGAPLLITSYYLVIFEPGSPPPEETPVSETDWQVSYPLRVIA